MNKTNPDHIPVPPTATSLKSSYLKQRSEDALIGVGVACVVVVFATILIMCL